jgi:integrase
MKRQFKNVAQEWVQEKRNFVKESTILAYELSIDNHLIREFGELDITKIDEGLIQTFVFKKIKNGLKEKTVKDLVVLLKMILKFSAKKNYRKKELIEVIVPAKEHQKGLDVLSNQEQKKLLEYLFNNKSPRNIGILICFFTGIRIGEICALKWEDIDIKTNTITINKTLSRVYSKKEKSKIIITSPKTKSSNRTIPFPKLIKEIFKAMKSLCKPIDYVISGSDKPVEPRTYRNHFNKVLDSVGVHRIKFHGTRHTFATRCIENNADYKTLSEILGHSNISTTLNVYVHPDENQKRNCIEKMIGKIMK